MATIEQLEPKIHYREQMMGARENLWRRPSFPAIRWGSIIAGVAVGMSIQLVLALLGIAAGLTLMDYTGSDVEVGYGSLIWAGASMLTAAFIGGYVAARMSGMRRKTDGALHGVVCWAVSTLLFAVMATSASSALLNGLLAAVGPEVPGNVQSSTQNGSQGSNVGVATFLRGQLGGIVGAADLQTLQQYIQTGQRDEAILLLSAMGIDPVRAGMVVDQALVMADNIEQESTQGPASANRAAESAGAAAWIVFLGVFLSLLLGVLGGLVGAMGSRRLIWKKDDAAAPRNEPDKKAT